MKKNLLKIVQWFLKILAGLKIRRVKPKIIAISGSFGKTSTKEAIYYLLSKKFGSDVGKNWGNMNSVIGLPLAILGLKKYSFGVEFFWDIIKAKWGFFFHHLAKILVLELGIDKPGEMKQLLEIVTPNIAVLTGISETHLLELKNISGVKREKLLLLNALKANGTAILNADDANLSDFTLASGIKKITFGKAPADISYSDSKLSISGTQFILKIKEDSKVVNSKLIGEHSIYTLLAAAAVADEFSININEIVSGLESITSQKGRMNIIKAKNVITIIDDSYNSNPCSAIEALNTLKKIEFPGRKTAILGNMNELGNYTKQGHLKVGEEAGESVDLLIVVGDNAKYLAEGAEKAGLEKEKIYSFKSTDETIDQVGDLLKAGDLVLIKASQNKMHFERIIKYLLDDSEMAKKVLVRQEKKWLQ